MLGWTHHFTLSVDVMHLHVEPCESSFQRLARLRGTFCNRSSASASCRRAPSREGTNTFATFTKKLGQCALSLLHLGKKLLAMVCDFQLDSCSLLSACTFLVQPHARLAGYEKLLLSNPNILWLIPPKFSHFISPHELLNKYFFFSTNWITIFFRGSMVTCDPIIRSLVTLLSPVTCDPNIRSPATLFL